MRKVFVLLFVLLGFTSFAYANDIAIEKFKLKVNQFQKDKLDVQVVDSLQKSNANIQGKYTFTINGLVQILDFKDGVSTINFPIQKSTLLYVKHINETGTHSVFVYASVKNEILEVKQINAFWLTLIPLLLVFSVLLYKKILKIALILLLIYIYVIYYHGLNTNTYFETIFDKLKIISNLINT